MTAVTVAEQTAMSSLVYWSKMASVYPVTCGLHISGFYRVALNAGWSSREKGVCQSVRPSVGLSNA